MAAANDAKFEGGKLLTDETGHGAAFTHNLVALADIAQEGDGHAENEIGDGFVGITTGVANGDAFGLADIHWDVVKAGEGDGEAFDLVEMLHDIGAHWLVGDDNDLCVLGAFDHFFVRGGALVVKGPFDLATEFFLEHAFEHVIWYAEWFQNNEFFH